jgi:DNA-binding NtrC family response regulator
MPVRILVVDDEEPVRRLLKKELTRKGFETETSDSGEDALNKLKKQNYDVILLDIVMPGMDGLDLLKKLKGDPASPKIIVLTGRATVDTAVEAMKNGAYDYLTKPYKLEELKIIIDRACEQRRIEIEHQVLMQELERKEQPDTLIGSGSHHSQLMALIDKIAPTDSTVLIQGESGTGKELVANFIWKRSRRTDRPLIALNCSTLSENLMESELFGHEKGAFTNAYKVKRGLVEAADRGTLFLDEIGEIPIGLQAKLLRFLDSGEFRRVGGNKNLNADVRVIAATNRNLKDAIKERQFREDLFYRLNVINIVLAPLRERREDILPLAEYFLQKFSSKFSKNVKGFSEAVLSMLRAYDWPGNVRELENVVERAVILSDDALIETDDIAIPGSERHETEGKLTGLSLEDMEKEHIRKVLEETGGNQTKASKILGIDRKTLYLKIRKYGLQGPF